LKWGKKGFKHGEQLWGLQTHIGRKETRERPLGEGKRRPPRKKRIIVFCVSRRKAENCKARPKGKRASEGKGRVEDQKIQGGEKTKTNKKIGGSAEE